MLAVPWITNFRIFSREKNTVVFMSYFFSVSVVGLGSFPFELVAVLLESWSVSL